jgi:hypothetical protein
MLRRYNIGKEKDVDDVGQALEAFHRIQTSSKSGKRKKTVVRRNGRNAGKH